MGEFSPIDQGRRTAIMDKRSISQLLDGAAFPAIILAVAVSQMKVAHHKKNTPGRDKRLAAELRVGERASHR
jgi:hypothetical protein